MTSLLSSVATANVISDNQNSAAVPESSISGMRETVSEQIPSPPTSRPQWTFHRQDYFLPPISLMAVILEIGLLIVVTLTITGYISQSPANQRMYGDEYEWLTNNTYLTSLAWQQNHEFPYWQPYIEAGQPQIDSPISFVLNPLSTVPSLIYGPVLGLRFSVILYALFVTLGGWTLGRVLGFGWLGRLLLALLCFGKGNVLSMFADTSFQLAAQQTYIPWILAGFLGTIWLKQRRWPIVLLAVMFMQMFWAGYVWFTYPVVMFLLVLTFLYGIVIQAGARNKRPAVEVRHPN